jgi:TP901 family phage tail tape measure protein
LGCGVEIEPELIMAYGLGTLFVRLTADASSLIGGMDSATRSVIYGTTRMQKDFAMLDRTTAGSMAGMAASTTAATSKIQRQLLLMSASLANAARNYAALAAAGGAAAAGHAATSVAYMNASTQMANAATNASSAAIVAGTAIKGLSTTALVGSVGLGLAAALGLREYAKFEQGMVGATAVMGGVTKELRAELELTARTIGKQSLNSAVELTKAYNLLASANYDAIASIKLLPIVDTFAIAGNLKLEKATSMLIDSMGSLGLKTGDASKDLVSMTRIADVLTEANRLGQGSVEEFGEALTHGGAQAIRVMNKSLEEGVALLAAFAEAGDRGASGGEHMFMAMRDISRVAIENKKVWTELFGIDVFDPITKKMNNVGVIFTQFEKLLRPLPDETRRLALSISGLQERSMKAMLTMLGASEKIKDFEKALLSAGGVTETMAKERLDSLINKLAVTWNNVKDLFIVIGQSLTPVLKDLNDWLLGVTESLGKAETQAGQVSATFTTLADMFKAAALGAVAFKTILDTLASSISGALIETFIGATAWLKTTIKLFENAIKLVKDLSTELTRVETVISKVNDFRKSFWDMQFGSGKSDATFSLYEELVKLWAGAHVAQRNFFTSSGKDIRTGMKEASAGIKEQIAFDKLDIQKYWKDLSDLADKYFPGGLWKKAGAGQPALAPPSAMDAHNAAVKFAEVYGSTYLTEYAKMEDKVTKIAVDDAKARAIEVYAAVEKAQKELDALSLSKKGVYGQLKTSNLFPELDSYFKKLEDIEESEKHIIDLNRIIRENPNIEGTPLLADIEAKLSAAKLIKKLQEESKLPALDHPAMGMISSEVDQALQANKEEANYKNQIARYEGLLKTKKDLTEESQKQIMGIIDNYTKRIALVETQKVKMALSSGEQMFTAFASMAESFGGKQSAAYKAMFAVEKAFAIGVAMVNIGVALSKAASGLPFPANLAAMAEVATQTASIVTNIMATRLAFAGEKAMGGPVSQGRAYLVGERGQEAFVPSQNGTILSNDVLMGRGQSTRVVINNYTDARPEVTERQEGNERVIQVMIRRAKDEISSEIREGRGNVTRALQGSFNLRRGQQ